MNTKTIRKLITLGLVVVLMLVFALTTKNFFAWRNISMLLLDSSYVGLLALGISFVIIGGGIDLSAGGIVCTAAIVCARMSEISGMPGIVCILAGIVVGAICGVINGLLVTKVHIAEFVTTLAMGFVYSGLGLVLAFRENGNLISKYLHNESFTNWGLDIGGVYYRTIAWILLAVIMYIVLNKTRFGLHTYAQGSNAKSAQMSGVNNIRIKIMGFVICGCFAGLAGAFTCAYQCTASASLGTGMEFQAIAACVVGGVALSGGSGDAVGAVLGAIFMQLITNGLNKYGLPVEYQYLFQGGIIILATSFDVAFNKRMARRMRRQANEIPQNAAPQEV